MRTAGQGDVRYLTRVQTVYQEGSCNFRVLFGKPIDSSRQVTTHGRTRGSVRFMRGARFAVDLWSCNRFGTRQWCCYVCEAIGPDEEGLCVPCVKPAARVLLSTRGAAQSRLLLAWLRELEEVGIDLLHCPAALFEAAHFRLQGSRADRTPPRRLSGQL
jgi:Protein of unknown function (DUF2840)